MYRIGHNGRALGQHAADKLNDRKDKVQEKSQCNTFFRAFFRCVMVMVVMAVHMLLSVGVKRLGRDCDHFLLLCTEPHRPV